ncbi:MAG: hypothetical protein ACRDVM_01840, partial [Acidimicrobiia bacterium]
LMEAKPDLVVLSVHPDITHSARVLDRQEYTRDMQAAIHLLKEHVGAHVIVFNASTVVPGVAISNYHGLDADAPPLKAHKVDLALMELSILEGISIVDVDRLLAEIGAGRHVLGLLDYSPEASDVICRELFRVIEDYGFFEERPLILQVGREQG